MDDQQRIALVETRTRDDRRLVREPAPIIRYQLSNHLGSSSLEVNENAAVISYEEYYPYGSTSYQAVQSDIEISAKRYRYTGMERDEETGLDYHTARYYAPWIGRWITCDPKYLIDGINIYQYGSNNPIIFYDNNGYEVRDEIEEIVPSEEDIIDIPEIVVPVDPDSAEPTESGIIIIEDIVIEGDLGAAAPSDESVIRLPDIEIYGDPDIVNLDDVVIEGDLEGTEAVEENFISVPDIIIPVDLENSVNQSPVQETERSNLVDREIRLMELRLWRLAVSDLFRSAPEPPHPLEGVGPRRLRRPVLDRPPTTRHWLLAGIIQYVIDNYADFIRAGLGVDLEERYRHRDVFIMTESMMEALQTQRDEIVSEEMRRAIEQEAEALGISPQELMRWQDQQTRERCPYGCITSRGQ